MFPTFATPTFEEILAARAAMPPVDPDPIVLAIMGEDEFETLKRMTVPAAPSAMPMADALTGIPVYCVQGLGGVKQVRRSELRGLTPGEFVDGVKAAVVGDRVTAAKYFAKQLVNDSPKLLNEVPAYRSPPAIDFLRMRFCR